MPLNHPPQFAHLNVFTTHPDPYYWLVEIQDPNGGPVLDDGGKQVAMRITPNTLPVTFAGQVYEQTPFNIGALKRDSSGGVSTIPLVFANVAARLQKILQMNDHFRDHRVIMTLVHSTLLNSPSSKVVIHGTVTNTSATWQSVTLLMSAYDNLEFDVPQQLITTKCGWTYRGKGCDFTGDADGSALGSCAKTLTACKMRGQWQVDNDPLIDNLTEADYPLFFGGFPGILVGSFS
jgi:phage-related protein